MRNRAGFTLVEVLVAVAIVGVIGVTVLGAFSVTLNAGAGVSARAEQSQIARFIVRKMTEDLQAATLLPNNAAGEFVGAPHKDGERDADEMVFTSFGRRVVYAGRGGDQALIRWYVRADAENPNGPMALRRRENPFITDFGTDETNKEEDWEITDALHSLTIRYFRPGGVVVDNWSSALGGQLPIAVDVAFELMDERGEVVRHTLFVTVGGGVT